MLSLQQMLHTLHQVASVEGKSRLADTFRRFSGCGSVIGPVPGVNKCLCADPVKHGLRVVFQLLLVPLSCLTCLAVPLDFRLALQAGQADFAQGDDGNLTG